MLPGHGVCWSAAGWCGKSRRTACPSSAELVHDGHGEQGNVLRTVPQRGSVMGKTFNRKKQVLSKAPVTNGLVEVLVRGRDDAYVHVMGRGEPSRSTLGSR